MSKAITFFGKMLNFSRLKIHTSDLSDIKNTLSELSDKHTVKGVLVIIDSDIDLDLNALLDLLRDFGLQPIGVVDSVLSSQAKQLKLAIFPADERIQHIHPKKTKAPKSPDITDAKADNRDTKEQTNAYATTDIVHNQIVRSGQSLQHLGGDLTIIGSVNAGGEAITDGNLHIYGKGLGRLVAGATGDKDARIFCQKFNPLLVSVAGTYCLREAIPPEMLDQCVIVSYNDQKGLVFDLLEL
ncbi:septum site-determining protein MinC [Moraxella nasovis]|uniref:septum site-determining protein MinC n=1 Tax=Moraxella nasovis TaxID=2904121 RepID=UPI001F60BE27|nr:septum site-determining protein MinC [Moraxella nasovis]UNU72765.1 septum site-determining protein MinC [Moraxella nasovis]